MSYGRLNIWLRELDCTPKNVWKVELVVKTCGGAYLVDFNPDVIEKLKHAFPAAQYTVDRGTRDGETTIVIRRNIYASVIKHLEVELPPGCYIVRAWVCSSNLWSDRAMVIVDCGETACVNLVIPPKESCIANVIAPIAIAAQELKLPLAKVNVAVEMLMRAGGVQKDAFARELTGLVRELRASKAEDAPKYAEAFDFLAKQVKGIRM